MVRSSISDEAVAEEDREHAIVHDAPDCVTTAQLMSRLWAVMIPLGFAGNAVRMSIWDGCQQPAMTGTLTRRSPTGRSGTWSSARWMCDSS